MANRNSNIEIRNKRAANRSQMGETSKPQIQINFVSNLELFVIWICFEFRISCFEFSTFSYLIGRVKVKVEPLPASLSTQIFPPCSSTNFFAMVNPTQVPSL